jgi:hypothetical protein
MATHGLVLDSDLLAVTPGRWLVNTSLPIFVVESTGKGFPDLPPHDRLVVGHQSCPSVLQPNGLGSPYILIFV